MDKLGTLLGRLQCVTKFSTGSKKVLEPLTHAITLGACKGFREVTIDDRNGVVPAQAFISLGVAIEADAMPLLQKLGIGGMWEKGGVQALLHGFSNGTCPQLHTLHVPLRCPLKSETGYEDDYDYQEARQYNKKGTEENLETLVAMLESRQHLGYCTGLKAWDGDWGRYGSLEVNLRLLRISLPNLERLEFGVDVLYDKNCA